MTVFNENIKPAFCPYNGKHCSCVSDECIPGGCGQIWENYSKEVPSGKVRICAYRNTCLIFDQYHCEGTESDWKRKECHTPLVIIKESDIDVYTVDNEAIEVFNL